MTTFWQTWGSEGRPFGWSIGSCHSKAGELSADVELTQASAVALLDAAIHIARLLDSDNPRLMVPAAVTSVRFSGELADPRGRVEVRRRGGNDEELVVDITATAPDGSTCIEVRGLRFAAVDSSAAAGRNDDPASMVHAIDWQPFTPDESNDGGPGSIVVLGDDDVAGCLRDGLTQNGYPSAAVADARYVLYVAESRSGESDVDGAVRMSMELVDLVRGLAERDESHPATLWIITRGVREGSSDAAVATEPAVGDGRRHPGRAAAVVGRSGRPAGRTCRSVRWCRRLPRCCGPRRSRSWRCAMASSSRPASSPSPASRSASRCAAVPMRPT